ncbi:hypothetical protein DL93DRAFT_2080920 [Clavulina sp. PMI_390]|nr:hypothetical protein DL93DRAFT_2080920 [Clavulina sp. PMI_390]
MAVYSRDVTQTILSVAIILSRFPLLCSLTLPYFLSAPLLPEWHATHNEHQTQTSFYLPPPSELVSAAQAAAFPPNEVEQQQNQTVTPLDGLVPTYVYFPAIREACETLREACPSLQRMGWCVPSFCIDPRVALVGPTALRVLEWEYQRLDRDVEVDDDESMTNGMAPGYGSPPASGVGEESVDDGDDENGEEPEDMDEDTPEGVWAVASVRIGAASDESISSRFA